MRQLSSICEDLASSGKVQQLLSLLQDQESANISTFEFLTSGAVHQLREFLAGADLMKGKAKVHVDSQKLLQRLHAFWEAAIAQGKDGTAPMQSLVRFLFAAILLQGTAFSFLCLPVCQRQHDLMRPKTPLQLIACHAMP